MAKRTRKQFQIITPAKEENERIFITSEGKKIPLKPVSRFLIDKRQASKKKINPPTYEIPLPNEGKEIREHDATTISTDEEKVAWAIYLEDKQKEESRFNRDFFKMLVLYGTEIEMPEDNFWELKQQSVGVVIPTDPIGKYLHYLESEYLVVEEDATDLMAKVLEISGTSKEDAEDIRKSFRTALQETRNRRLQIIEEAGVGS